MNINNTRRKDIINDYLRKIVITLSLPSILYYLYSKDVILLQTFQLLMVPIFFFHIFLPVLYKFNYTFQRYSVFLNFIPYPPFAQFDHPEKYGLKGTRNFYFERDDGVKLGMWHILPEVLIKENLQKEDEEEYFEKCLSYGIPVVIYMHGNLSNRTAGHHLELHKILREYYHVITFDYRGYGDSTGVSFTEGLLVNDAIAILKWIRQLSTGPILVWGHSLGTSVALHSLRQLTDKNDCFVEGLVLESPFDNMYNEVAEHPTTFIFKNLPWFTYTVLDPMYNSGFVFQSDEHIKYVNCPIFILHAEDDWIVPFELGYRLYLHAKRHRKPHQGSIKFQRFSGGGYGHKHICRAPDFPNIVKDFYDQCLQK